MPLHARWLRSIYPTLVLGSVASWQSITPKVSPTALRNRAVCMEVEVTAPLPLLQQPAAAMDCWRPTIDDVDRISWGRNAKKKGTGSRGVPHRLNDEERTLYDFARRKGFVEIAGSGWRKQRSASPLVNTFRSWCDARGVPAIYIHKSRDGLDDELVVDLSPLRTPLTFQDAAAYCMAEASGGVVELEGSAIVEDESSDAALEAQADDADAVALIDVTQLADAYASEPIYRLPMYAVSWVTTRAEAKQLAKQIAAKLSTAESASKGRRKEKGAPNIKPGKSRRHGGYGIG